MASYSTRLNRKLPKNGNRHDRTKAFWPTNSTSFVWVSFQGALQWIRKNEETISRFATLLQIYPNLIQDSSLDTFWEFMGPLLEQQGQVEAKSVITHEWNRPQANVINTVWSKPPKAKGVPAISVTRTSESPVPIPSIPSRNARTPRVHLISCCKSTAPATNTLLLPTTSGNHGDDDGSPTPNSSYLHQCVVGLLHDHFYVRIPPPQDWQQGQGQHDTNSNTHQQQWSRLVESDVCLFLLDHHTMDDPHCFHDLCTALALKIPVVYLRHHRQELPKTFAQSVERHGRGCVSLEEYIDKFVFGGKPAMDSKRKNDRPRSKLAPLSVRTRSSSAGELLSITGYNVKRGRKKQKPTSSDTDLLLYLINKFQTSYVFDENDLPRCSCILRWGIYQAIGITEYELPPLVGSSRQRQNGGGNNHEENHGSGVPKEPRRNGKNVGVTLDSWNRNDMNENRSNRLNVPDRDNMLLAREWSNSGSVSAPPHDESGREDRFQYDFRSVSPVSLETKSTTYLLFDQQNTNRKIRRIHFPLDDSQFREDACETDSDEFDPSGSPIHFPDIDLGREINATMDTTEYE